MNYSVVLALLCSAILLLAIVSSDFRGWAMERLGLGTNDVTTTSSSTSTSTSTTVQTTTVREQTTIPITDERRITSDYNQVPYLCTLNSDCGVEYYGKMFCDSYRIMVTKYRPTCPAGKCIFKSVSERLGGCTNPDYRCFDDLGCWLTDNKLPKYFDVLLVSSYDFGEPFLGKVAEFRGYYFRVDEVSNESILLEVLDPTNQTRKVEVVMAERKKPNIDNITVFNVLGNSYDQVKDVKYATIYVHSDY